MKRVATVFFGSLVSCFAVFSTAAAQELPDFSQDTPIALANTEAGAMYNSCIQQFYDRDMYNWLSFRNTCGNALNVTYRWNNGTAGGAVRLQPGDKESIGYTSEQVHSKGGATLAVCRLGWIPVDGNNQYWTGGQYRCKEQ